MKFNRINPLTGEIASTAMAMKAADIPAIAERAAAGFFIWSTMGPNARRSAGNRQFHRDTVDYR